MSHASENLVTCARRDDLGCPASYPGSRHDAIKAAEAGWFHSRTAGAYCPDHVPSWVAGWRARREAARAGSS